ncbi:hypothetical protein DSO57_1024664, partial [Entomophthora muscae]
HGFLPHIFYPNYGQEDLYRQQCKRFVQRQTPSDEWARISGGISLTLRGKKFLSKEFKTLFQELHTPPEESVSQVQGGAVAVAGRGTTRPVGRSHHNIGVKLTMQ